MQLVRLLYGRCEISSASTPTAFGVPIRMIGICIVFSISTKKLSITSMPPDGAAFRCWISSIIRHPKPMERSDCGDMRHHLNCRPRDDVLVCVGSTEPPIHGMEKILGKPFDASGKGASQLQPGQLQERERLTSVTRVLDDLGI
jgi:hypothetical protein